MFAETGEAVRTGANETVMQKAVLMLAVGRGRNRRQVERGEQTFQRGGSAVEIETECEGILNINGGDPVADDVAKGSNAQEPAQAEGHRLGIETRAVVEENVLAQRNRDGAPIRTDLRECRCQTRLQLPPGVQHVEGIPQRTEQLNGAAAVRLGRIERTDTAS